MTSVSHNSCGVFATPGPTSSSNSKNYTITLFSERPVGLMVVLVVSDSHGSLGTDPGTRPGTDLSQKTQGFVSQIL